MNILILLSFILVVLCWTFNPFIKKKILKTTNLKVDEYFVINHFVITILLIGYFIYIYKKGECSSNCIKQLTRYDCLYILLGSITSILGARLLLYIIKTNDISFMVAHIQPLVILLSFLIGYIFFMEKMNIYRIFGGILVIIGIILLNITP
tara:strand:- start:1155 stop:1607 length:453 start_codon:yes stop_codon:yes gene_type:complete